MIRVVIVDDEEPARERMRLLLAAVPDVEVVGEAANGEQALARIGELHPDLVLLDIQMRGITGLEVAACLPRPRPRIIFCTAFDQYAVDAFELHAVDYLLKPVSRVRLAHAIERIRSKPESVAEADVDHVTDAIHGYCTRFLARCGDRLRIIPQQDVVSFSSEGGLSRVNTRERQFVIDPSLNDLEERLDPGLFCRISRAAIVNLDAVTEVRPMIGGIANVALNTGVVLEVSRRRVKELLDRLQGARRV
ncbi:MAG: response regulator [Acidobacteria bacterium]|nr:MAG: response regulator [Acidobacteriota bacterium]